MTNTTWTSEYLTLELLPCGTIHMESSAMDENDEELLTFDKVNKIVVLEDDLILECSDMTYDYIGLGLKFLRETKGLFPVSNSPTPVSPMNFVKGEWAEDGSVINLLYVQDNQLHLIEATPGGDRKTTTF
jgi:hypothetical protein